MAQPAVVSETSFFLAILTLVLVVGAFAWMPKPKWLDTIWLWIIGIAFAIYFPIYTILKAQDLGLWNVVLIYLALFLFGMYRGWPTDPPPQRSDSR